VQSNQTSFNIMFRVIAGIIAFGFLLILSFWIFIAVQAVDAAEDIGEVGVQGVIQKLWCGRQNPNCDLPAVGQ
jgi:hypothetical protein